jgi:hypothetical protein
VSAKKPLQSKKSGVNTQVAQPLRKRAALGDVSNVTKGDVVDVKKNAGKGGLVSKAAQPTGVQKSLSRTNSSRSVLGAKDMNKKSSDVKRTGSGSGVMAVKRKTSESSSTFSIKEETPAEEEQPLRKKIHIEQVERRVTVEEYKENEVVQDVEPKESVTSKSLQRVSRTWTARTLRIL